MSFEEKFMEIQKRIVATCLEALEENVDMVDYLHIYAFRTDYRFFAKPFLVVDSKVAIFESFGMPSSLTDQVYDLTRQDINEINELCKENGKKAPHQFKLTYNNRTNSLDTEYSYDDLRKSPKDPMEIYFDWKDEIASKFK